MKILVTGGAGFIGSHIVDGYIAAGHEVVIIDDLSVGRKEHLNPQTSFYQVDITDLSTLESIFAKEKPDTINHHAAQKFLRRSVDFPAEDATINIIGSINLLQLARKHQVKRFIFASTAAVYGDDAVHLPYTEDYSGHPIAPYGVAKRSVEDYLYTYQLNYGLQIIALRYANVYGPRQDPHGESGVIAIFTEQLLSGQPTTIYGTGEQTRDYLYIDDVVKANLVALESDFSGAINISTGRETSLNVIYHEIGQLADSSQQPTYAPGKKGDPARLVLDNKKAASLLGWQPTVAIQEGLKKTVEWFRSRK